MEIKIKKLSENAIIPTCGSAYSAGYDLYSACEDMIVPPHKTVKIPTDIAVAIPEGYFGGIYPRSGYAVKRSLRPANCVGVIDADYRGNIIVALHNDSDVEQSVGKGERIAQMIIQRFEPLTFEVADELPETERGEGGFGSTGVR